MKAKVSITDPMEIVDLSVQRGDVVDIFLTTGVRFKAVVRCVGEDAIAISTPDGGAMVIRWEAFASMVNNSITLE